MNKYSRQELFHRYARLHELLALLAVESMSAEQDEAEMGEYAAELMRMVREDGAHGMLDIDMNFKKGALRITFSATLSVSEAST